MEKLILEWRNLICVCSGAEKSEVRLNPPPREDKPSEVFSTAPLIGAETPSCQPISISRTKLAINLGRGNRCVLTCMLGTIYLYGKVEPLSPQLCIWMIWWCDANHGLNRWQSGLHSLSRLCDSKIPVIPSSYGRWWSGHAIEMKFHILYHDDF